MKGFSLFLKYTLAYGIFAFISIFVTTSLAPYLLDTYLTHQSASLLYRQGNLMVKYKQLTIEELVKEARLYNSRILLINTKGQVLLDSQNPKADKNSLPLLSQWSPVSTTPGFYQVGTYFDALDAEAISVHVPIRQGVIINSYLSLHLPLSQLQTPRHQILQIIYSLLSLVLLLGFLFLSWIYIWLLLPLKKNHKILSHLEKGQYQQELTIETKDELGYTLFVTNLLAQRLRQGDERQNAFIANISHDFRSPLTSMKGYLEAILDGTIPPEKYQHYLQIVLQQTQRLTKLTEGLLTMSRLDNSQIVLDYTHFDLHQVIRETASSFEGICQTRQIAIHLTLAAKELFVYADMSKIQQVLANLLDNAIKFSPDHSDIEISTTLQAGKVFLRIKDQGMGIANQDLDKVWNRFYKTDHSRGKDKTGAGLGLAIVKEIIQLHNQDISLTSKLDVGSEFVFTLMASNAKSLSSTKID